MGQKSYKTGQPFFFWKIWICEKGKILIFEKTLDLFEFRWKFRFLAKFFILVTNLDLLPQVSLFRKNFDFWENFRFLTKIFGKTFYYSKKFRFLRQMLTFEKNFDFWQKCWISTKISIFGKKIYSGQKFRFSIKFWEKISSFDFDFGSDILFLSNTR